MPKRLMKRWGVGDTHGVYGGAAGNAPGERRGDVYLVHKIMQTADHHANRSSRVV